MRSRAPLCVLQPDYSRRLYAATRRLYRQAEPPAISRRRLFLSRKQNVRSKTPAGEICFLRTPLYEKEDNTNESKMGFQRVSDPLEGVGAEPHFKSSKIPQSGWRRSVSRMRLQHAPEASVCRPARQDALRRARTAGYPPRAAARQSAKAVSGLLLHRRGLYWHVQ